MKPHHPTRLERSTRLSIAAPPQAPFPGCGRYVYTASRDSAVKKWDVSPAGDRDLLTAQSMNALFTPDGRLEDLVSAVHSRVTRALNAEECRQYLHLGECP